MFRSVACRISLLPVAFASMVACLSAQRVDELLPPVDLWTFVGYEDGRPIYLVTDNAQAAISIAVDTLRSSTSLGSPMGSGITVGLWDAGMPRATHQELAGRVANQDGAGIVDHATLTAGTIAASGVMPAAMGMAPQAAIESWDWNSDTNEMSARGRTSPSESNRLAVSNHSYGQIAGWHSGNFSGNNGPHWFGDWPAREDSDFGRYNSKAAAWDAVCHAAPYYLPVKSAGNDRGNTAPSTGTTFYYFDSAAQQWMSKAYDPMTDPFSDGTDAAGNVGYDSLSTFACTKNILAVGAINDAVSQGVRSLGAATMSSFSSWGPVDDGRIKPDLVANGVSLFSSCSAGDADYKSASGTSLAAPCATGTIALLLDVFETFLPGTPPRASTLKALLIHTADDLGIPGPDYSNGFGLIDATAAAQLIFDHALSPSAGTITESFVDATVPTRTIWLQSTGAGPLVATMAWTDPAGAVKTGLDNPQPDLVNDLDVRLVDNSTGVVHSPWILDRLNPSAPASTGDNVVDVNEQIVIVAPGAGHWTLEISHKGSLSGGRQDFSLVVSGAFRPVGSPIASLTDLGVGCPSGPNGPPSFTATLPVLGSLFEVTGIHAPSSAPGFLAVSAPGAIPIALPGGCLVRLDVATAFVASTFVSDGNGGWSSTLPIPFLPSIAGFPFRQQAFIVDVGASDGWSTTQAVDAVIGFQP